MPNISLWYLRTAVVVALLGMALGLYMASAEDFTLAPVHAHVNLIGWLSFFAIGLYYRAFPEAGRGRLAAIQFSTFLAGVLVMVVSLAMLLTTGNSFWGPFTGLGGVLLLIGMAMFAVTVFRTRATALSGK